MCEYIIRGAQVNQQKCFYALYHTQKQPQDVFRKKRCSQKFPKIHRKLPVSDLFFNEAADATFFAEQLWTTASEYDSACL